MLFLYSLAAGFLFYFLGLIVAFLFNGSGLKNISIVEILSSGIIFTLLFAIAIQTITALAQNKDISEFIWYLPIFFVILKSHDYIIQPYIYLFFRKDSLTSAYDEILNSAGIKAKIVTAKKIKNAYATGLLPGNSTIILGQDLIDQMQPEQIAAIIYHEIAHQKKHLYVILIIDLIVFYLFFGLSYFAYQYFPDSLGIRVLAFGILGGIIPFLSLIMRRFELQADCYAALKAGKETYIEALSKLNLISGGKMERFDISHPKLQKRISHIEKCCPDIQ